MPDGTGADAGSELLADPWDGDARLPEFFGDAWPAVDAYHAFLKEEGELRGLLGPRELPRLWERHLLNSAAVVPFLPRSGLIVDIGSGAGLPGIVVAAMRPDAEVMLVEPMERRVTWLMDVVERTGLTNVDIRRARAQELDGAVEADAVTARAVASLDKLYRWTVPLVRVGGRIVAMKGARAGDELAEAAPVMRKLGLTDGEVHEAITIAGTEPTRIVTAVRGRGPRVR
ncbi:16S rRNA (guanine(527)-N(7))-methyltransferase RsmG [Cellulomonas sp. zg-ZUI22]|uniref:16S rRNA (guanine(527)-N(7))-methyltransferase RsmG n=1 Tax=Cellulomonas sp. zg-ZUI22 TaxID=2816955 RepID=UPI001A952AB2|nr:16S rRNA (guanine(527)-N(7))-methyltransferase RsmG [Cellulomonas sp. zg-ZUI22]MBO0898611.1 16S rRNA (guanine(527)-N(7))-methyltransferase RsmG [Cellulomonas sp. zg-ZUI22]